MNETSWNYSVNRKLESKLPVSGLDMLHPDQYPRLLLLNSRNAHQIRPFLSDYIKLHTFSEIKILNIEKKKINRIYTIQCHNCREICKINSVEY